MDVVSAVLQNLFSPTCLIFMLMGCVLGIIFGALPGLSGTVGVTLLLPMTYSMSSELGIAMLISIWVGGVSGGFISATLLGIPGTASCIATCFDAYPLSKQGKSRKALMTGIIGSHTNHGGMLQKAARIGQGENPFIDPEGFAKVIDSRLDDFRYFCGKEKA